MAKNDCLRWNERYRAYNSDQRLEPRQFLIEVADMLPAGGKALDIAMGLGANSAFLAQRGYTVIGVDISFVALRKAKQKFSGINILCADMEQISFPPSTFDVIIDFYYLERDLWTNLRHWLKPGGYLVVETLLIDMLKIKPDLDKRYLLEPNELINSFSDYEILIYREGWTAQETIHPRSVASMVAVRPPSPKSIEEINL